MKNVTINKLSAVALAAVMAVTFAPVTSMNVFAAKKKKSINSTNPSTYTLASGENEVEINTSQIGIITVDLNGQQDVKVTVVATNANVVLTDTKGASVPGVVGGRQYAKLSQLTNKASKSLTITGNMSVARGAVEKKDITNTFKDNNTPVPVAVTSDSSVYLVGSALINGAAADGSNIEAVNGAVAVTGLKSGASATIGKDADADTTIKATAAANTALTRIVTTYTYYYENRAHSATYTDSAYYAGSTKGKTAVENLPKITVASPKTASGVSVYSIPTYTREITINTNGESWAAAIRSTGALDVRDTDAGTTAGKVFGLTYFTTDPTAYTEGTLAAIDGNKYVLGTAELKQVTTNSAQSPSRFFAAANIPMGTRIPSIPLR